MATSYRSHAFLDTLAALVGLAWDAVLLALLWRIRSRGLLFLVVAFTLASLYTIDRALPRVVVDAWPNFDAARSPAMRPWIGVPDAVAIAGLAMMGRWRISRPAVLLAATLAAGTAAGLVLSIVNASAPLSAALFWATVPLRGVLVILIVDSAVHRYGTASATSQVVSAAVLGAAVLAAELIAVTALKAVADMVGMDLARVWSGFDWVRPNLPGWNNNIAASAIAFGASACILLPHRTWWPRAVGWTVVIASALALLASEYRTAIIVFVASVAVRVSIEVLRRTRKRMGSAAFVPAVGAGALSAVLLFGLAAAAVPRLSALNVVSYLSETVDTEDTPDPSATPATGGEVDTSSQSRAEILKAAITVWQREPLTGPGLGAWEFDRPTEPTFLQKAITPHNGFAWALADMGLVGLVGFYLLPAAMVLWRRPPFALFVWVVLLAVLEVSIVGIAHSRMAVLYWAALAVVALSPKSAPEPSDRVPP